MYEDQARRIFHDEVEEDSLHEMKEDERQMLLDTEREWLDAECIQASIGEVGNEVEGTCTETLPDEVASQGVPVSNVESGLHDQDESVGDGSEMRIMVLGQRLTDGA